MRKHYRHGDLLIEEIATIPADTMPIDGRILAHGEATGHAHRLTGVATLYEPTTPPTTDKPALYFELVETATVTHEEHGAQPLPAGTYSVTRQREWTDADEPRQVAD